MFSNRNQYENISNVNYMFKKNYSHTLTQQFDKPNTFSNLIFQRTYQQVSKANLNILDFVQ